MGDDTAPKSIPIRASDLKRKRQREQRERSLQKQRDERQRKKRQKEALAAGMELEPEGGVDGQEDKLEEKPQADEDVDMKDTTAALNASEEKSEEKQEEKMEEKSDEKNEVSETAAAAEDATKAAESESAAAAFAAANAPSALEVALAEYIANNADSDDEDDAAAALPSLLDLLNSFSDQVNRVPWRRCAFSHSSDFILAGSSERGEHRVFIWSIDSGQLTKILHGPTEGLLDLVTHPSRPILTTCCTSGVIYVWSKNYVENWSAFAPDFEELDDNQESADNRRREKGRESAAMKRLRSLMICCAISCRYVEREDEFDLVPLHHQKMTAAADSDDAIDILTCDPDELDREGQLITLPTIIQPDPETMAAWQKRLAANQERIQQTEATANEKGGSASMQQ